MFSIDVSISTSSDVWDLAADDFPVTIELTLPEDAGSPITFRNSNTGLFNRKLGEQGGGLVYRSLEKPEDILELGRVFVCTFDGGSRRPLPLNRGVNESAFMMLYPGKNYTIFVAHKSSTELPGYTAPQSERKKGELEQRRPDRESVGRWPLAPDFGGGTTGRCTWQCDISKSAIVSEWWKRSKEEILAARPPGTWLDDENQVVAERHDIILYNVIKTANFVLKSSVWP